jgi:hypothetical protein
MSNGERAHNFTPDRTPGATFARGLSLISDTWSVYKLEVRSALLVPLGQSLIVLPNLLRYAKAICNPDQPGIICQREN